MVKAHLGTTVGLGQHTPPKKPHSNCHSKPDKLPKSIPLLVIALQGKSCVGQGNSKKGKLIPKTISGATYMTLCQYLPQLPFLPVESHRLRSLCVCELDAACGEYITRLRLSRKIRAGYYFPSPTRSRHFLLDNWLWQEYKDQPQGAASRVALKRIVTISILGRYRISYQNSIFGIALSRTNTKRRGIVRRIT